LSSLPELLDTDDLVRLLKVSEKTIRRMVLRKQFPKPLKIGGQNRWHPDDVAQAIEAHRRSTKKS
jgi:predicted DNA-binding transcriptional regulator AlpA